MSSISADSDALTVTGTTRSSRAAAIRGLVWTLVRTDFKVRYHGTIGGFVWALAKPTAMFVLLLSVFSFIFGSDPNYKFNLIIGLFLWDFFAESTKAGLMSLQARAFLLTRARCPSWILVVTSIANAMTSLLVFSAVILIALSATGRPPSLFATMAFVGYCVALTFIVVGFSLGSSVLFLRYRDLNQVWDLVTQAGFFVAPIIYPLGMLPERYHIYLYAWPPTPIVEFTRDVLVRGVTPSVPAHLYLVLLSVTCLVGGGLIFRRYAPRAAEYL
jgi:lipopolysaccharide transport system permease protein